MKKTTVLIFILTGLLPVVLFGQSQDKLLQILKEELNRHAGELKSQPFPPYYMNYRVIDTWNTVAIASFGVKGEDQFRHSRIMIPHLRLGDPGLDNFKYTVVGTPISNSGPTFAELPIDDEQNEDAIRQAIWMEVCGRYSFATEIYERTKAQSKVSVKGEDKSPCFSSAPVENYYEEPLSKDKLTFERQAWTERLKKITALFNEDMNLVQGTASLTYMVERRYFVDTEGREIVQNLPYARLLIEGGISAMDGMTLPLYLSYFAFTPDGIPSDDKLMADTRKMIQTLKELRNAPVAEPYSGPALLAGPASGVFFHEIFGHRIEGQRMKTDEDGQTFKNMVNEPVLAADLQVFDDPTLQRYGEEELNGHYKFDEQGVKAQRVEVVKDGVLKNFLMSRTPLDNFPASNGHGRASGGSDPSSRQSNLIIETKKPKTSEELRKMLVDEARKQNKEYGYFFKEVVSGLTYTGKNSTNSFNVKPLLVYRVYVDGRPDELVRGVTLIGTPLSMFSNIVCAGDDPSVFVGTCGAESGGVAVSAVSPTILVSKVETQRAAKSNNLPPILPREYVPGK